MCTFKSAVIVPDEREKGGVKVYHNQWTDSHEELISFFKLNDRLGKLARVEYRPNDVKDLADLKKYKLIIDEPRTPEWFDAEKQEFVADYLHGVVDGLILKGDVEILLGGVYIVPKGVTIGFAKQTMMIYVAGTVTRNDGTVTTNAGTVTRNDGTVTRNAGTVTTNAGTVTTNDGTVTRNDVAYGKIMQGNQSTHIPRDSK